MNILGHRNTLTKFQIKILLDKSSIKVIIHKIIGKLLAKINTSEHILPIFLINSINILKKQNKTKQNNKIQIIFQQQFLNNHMSDLSEIW